ncbi:GIY-YIG nuclease family protein [Patescibacteria group bacterium]|nr:GIY-YIG nuclease family protein [Patescibacteria group bacterium]
MNSKYYAYLARCSDNSLYAGYTTNLEDREIAHNAGKGARYTSMRRPVKIVYSESFGTKSDAMKREYQFKHISKKEKENLIVGDL